MNNIHNKLITKKDIQDIVNKYLDNPIKINNIDKPIQTISSYKVQDLIDICTKLAIETINTDTGKIKSKNDLYESIIQYF